MPRRRGEPRASVRRVKGKFARIASALRVSALALALLAPPTLAQSTADPDPADLINFAYVMDSGFGGFSLSGRSVQVFRIPFSYNLRSLEERSLGLKLTLPVSFGVHNLKATVDDEARPLDRLRTITFVPGLEFQLALGSRTVLKPFVEAGFGRETNGSGATVYLYSAGVKTLTTRPSRSATLGLGTNVEWNGVSGEQGGSDDFGVIEVGFEAVYPLPASLAGRRLDIGPYVILRYFYSDLVFERLGEAATIDISSQAELGVSLGTEEPLRVLGVKLPRLGLAYRFGGGLESWRINFGFPF